MTIPANITSELASLQQQVAAAEPIANASRATKEAIKLNAAQLVSDIETALTAPSALDTWTAPIDPVSIIAGVNSIVVTSSDAATLSLMRGITGRAASNLDQI